MGTPSRNRYQDDDRPAPNNLNAERSILGAVLLDNTSLKVAREKMDFGDFFHAAHRQIFLSMISLSEKNSGIDLVTLTEELSQQQKLEASGGAAYLSQLMDGMPRVSNIAYYCEIVHEKAMLRHVMATANHILHRAGEEFAKPAELADELLKSATQTGTPYANPAIVVGFADLLTLKLQPAEFVIEPLLTVGGVMMLYSPAGAGKSFVQTEIATCLALGPENNVTKIFPWPLKRRFRVLYVYGEMHGSMIQERAISIAKGHGVLELPDDFNAYFGVMCKEFQRMPDGPRHARGWRPSIATELDRKYVRERTLAGGFEVLILDNISTLWPASQEGDSDRAARLQDWLIDLNQAGISVIELHHAGKSGEQLGSSTHEHILDSTVKLVRPANYEKEQQLRCEVRIQKVRAECRDPRLLAPFEISLRTGMDDGAQWLMKPSKYANLQAAFEMFSLDMKAQEISRELNIPARTVYRYQKQYKENPRADFHMDEKA